MRDAEYLPQGHLETGHMHRIEQDPGAAEDALDDHDDQRPDGEMAQPCAFLGAPEPDHGRDADQPHHGAAQAMRMLGKHREIPEPALGVDRAVGQWPVRERHPGADAGREGPQRHQDKDPGSADGGKPSQAGLVAGCAPGVGSKVHEQSERSPEGAMLPAANPLTIFSSGESVGT